MSDDIRIIGAREHNLKNIDVRIPRNQPTVITGLSGSGKSSLAFDTECITRCKTALQILIFPLIEKT
jgi:excinuclease UvrABC ATPase subunit